MKTKKGYLTLSTKYAFKNVFVAHVGAYLFAVRTQIRLQYRFKYYKNSCNLSYKNANLNQIK